MAAKISYSMRKLVYKGKQTFFRLFSRHSYWERFFKSSRIVEWHVFVNEFSTIFAPKIKRLQPSSMVGNQVNHHKKFFLKSI